MPHDRPSEPWHSFFLEIDKTLDRPVALHCIGGFAMAMLHGLPRSTVDVDCLTAIPVEETAPLQLLAGQGSALHKKYGVYAQHVGIVTVPENYADRLTPMFPAAYRRLLRDLPIQGAQRAPGSPLAGERRAERDGAARLNLNGAGLAETPAL